MANRVDFVDDRDSGVARSSRPGKKRIVKARPTIRGELGSSNRTPRSQTLRNPLFRSAIVTVAVEKDVKAACASSFISEPPAISSDARYKAAVDPDQRSRDVGRLNAGEKGDDARVFLRPPVAAHRDIGGAASRDLFDGSALPRGSRLVERRHSRRRDAARSDDIDRHAVPSDLARQRFRPPDQGGAKRVRDRKIGDRRDHSRGRAGDDPPPSASTHRRQTAPVIAITEATIASNSRRHVSIGVSAASDGAGPPVLFTRMSIGPS